MKTGKSGTDGAGNKDGASEDWEQQVDYPVAGGPQRVESQAQRDSSLEERIRFKAWLRAKDRGFSGGDEVVDWLEAEREVQEEDRERNGGVSR